MMLNIQLKSNEIVIQGDEELIAKANASSLTYETLNKAEVVGYSDNGHGGKTLFVKNEELFDKAATCKDVDTLHKIYDKAVTNEAKEGWSVVYAKAKEEFVNTYNLAHG